MKNNCKGLKVKISFVDSREDLEITDYLSRISWQIDEVLNELKSTNKKSKDSKEEINSIEHTQEVSKEVKGNLNKKEMNNIIEETIRELRKVDIANKSQK